MDKLVYTALSGLKGKMDAQATIANNIANASTIGYRADRVNFERMLVQGDGLNSRQPSVETVVDLDRRAGAMVQTGRQLDVALAGEGWIAVQSKNGEEAYTRRGDLQVALSGVLETGDGFPVIGANGPITLPPYEKLMISPEGSISIIPPGADPAAPPQVVDQIKIVSDQGSNTVKGLDNLLYVRGGGLLPQDMDATLQVGTLEQSNVNLTQALVDMIENQRSYEVQANLLKEAKTMDESSASLLRVN